MAFTDNEKYNVEVFQEVDAKNSYVVPLKQPEFLYHYTTKKGAEGIKSSKKMFASLHKKENDKDVRTGEGVYFSDISPEQIVLYTNPQNKYKKKDNEWTLAEMAKLFYNMPLWGSIQKKFEFVITVNVSKLSVKVPLLKGNKVEKNIFVHLTSDPLDVNNIFTVRELAPIINSNECKLKLRRNINKKKIVIDK